MESRSRGVLDTPPARGMTVRQNVPFCVAAKLLRWPLLTGNGNSAGFSVLVGWHASFGAVLFALHKKYEGDTCIS